MNLPFSTRNPTRRDTRGGAAREEGGLRRHEGARGGGSDEFLKACGSANGPETRADHAVCVATRGSRYAKSTRPKRATHEGENEGETKHIFIRTQRTRMPQPPHATTFCLQSSISRSHSHTRGGQRASERDRTAAAARERRKIDVFGRLCGVQGHRLCDNLAALPAGKAPGRPYQKPSPGRGQL